MFSDLVPIVDFLFDNLMNLFDMVWSAGWIGVIVICLPLARRVIDILKKLF